MSTPEAGRELDALIAEKVMGWSQFPYIVCHASDSGIVQQWGATVVTLHHCPPGAVHVSTIERVPDYSTDIAAAWLVVEKLRTVHGFREVSVSHFDGLWRFVLWIDPDDDYEVMEYGTTAPLAICRAALAAHSGGTP